MQWHVCPGQQRAACNPGDSATYAPDAPHDVDDQRRGVEQDQEVASVVREPAHRGGQQRLPHRHLQNAVRHTVW
jgi:hypothetical protein